MKPFLFLSLLIIVFSCTSNKREPVANGVPEIDGKYTEADYGELLGTFQFQVKALPEDEKEYEEGLIPWISLDDTDKETARLVDAKEIIVPFQTISILIDYPLNNPFEFKITSTAKGFNREELAIAISKKYHEIYDEEENSATSKTIPLEKRTGVINRNETNGKYGIWGHDLSDLDLSSVEVYKDDQGKILVVLIIES